MTVSKKGYAGPYGTGGSDGGSASLSLEDQQALNQAKQHFATVNDVVPVGHVTNINGTLYQNNSGAAITLTAGIIGDPLGNGFSAYGQNSAAVPWVDLPLANAGNTLGEGKFNLDIQGAAFAVPNIDIPVGGEIRFADKNRATSTFPVDLGSAATDQFQLPNGSYVDGPWTYNTSELADVTFIRVPDVGGKERFQVLLNTEAGAKKESFPTLTELLATDVATVPVGEVRLTEGFLNRGVGQAYWERVTDDLTGVPGARQATDGSGHWFIIRESTLTPLMLGGFPDPGQGAVNFAAIDEILRFFGRATGALTTGKIEFPPVRDATGFHNNYGVSDTIVTDQQSIEFDLLGNTISWQGATNGTMFRIDDCSSNVVRNGIVLGDIDPAVRPNIAFFYDQTRPGATQVAGNEYCRIENITIGDWKTVGDQFDRGIVIGGAVNGNNDEFRMGNIRITNVADACIDITTDQAVWSRWESILCNQSGVGIRSGSNFNGSNMTFNRCGIDMDLYRPTENTIRSYNSENSTQPIRITQNSSISIVGGKCLLTTAQGVTPDPVWFNAINAGRVSFSSNFTLRQQAPATSIIDYRQSDGFDRRGNFYVDSSCAIDEMESARIVGSTNQDTTVSVYGEDVINASNEAPFSPDWLLTSNTPPQAGNVTFANPIAVSKVALGEPLISSYELGLNGVYLTANSGATGIIQTRFANRTGADRTVLTSAVRIRRMRAQEISYRISTIETINTLANGQNQVIDIVFPGAMLGNHFVAGFASTNGSTLMNTLYLESANLLRWKFSGVGGGIVGTDTQLVTVYKINPSGHCVFSAEQTITVVDNAVETITIPAPGSRVGDFVRGSESVSLQELHRWCEAGVDEIYVHLWNDTGADVTLTNCHFSTLLMKDY